MRPTSPQPLLRRQKWRRRPARAKKGTFPFNTKNLSTNQRRATLNELVPGIRMGRARVAGGDASGCEKKFGLKRTNRQLWKIIVIVSCLSTLFCGILLGLMFFANEASKETRTVGRKLESLDGQVVVTENPTSYATLLDIPIFPCRRLIRSVSSTLPQKMVPLICTSQAVCNSTQTKKLLKFIFRYLAVGLRITSTNATWSSTPLATSKILRSLFRMPRQYNERECCCVPTRAERALHCKQARLHSHMG